MYVSFTVLRSARFRWNPEASGNVKTWKTKFFQRQNTTSITINVTRKSVRGLFTHLHRKAKTTSVIQFAKKFTLQTKWPSGLSLRYVKYLASFVKAQWPGFVIQKSRASVLKWNRLHLFGRCGTWTRLHVLITFQFSFTIDTHWKIHASKILCSLKENIATVDHRSRKDISKMKDDGYPFSGYCATDVKSF